MIKKKASTRPVLAYDVQYAAGRPARMTTGLALVATSGTRSIREECVPHASISGPQHSVFLVPAGRHTPIGTCISRIPALGRIVYLASSRNSRIGQCHTQSTIYTNCSRSHTVAATRKIVLLGSIASGKYVDVAMCSITARIGVCAGCLGDSPWSSACKTRPS